MSLNRVVKQNCSSSSQRPRVCTLPSSFRDALLPAIWYRDDAGELRVRGERCEGQDEERGESPWFACCSSEFPSPFSGAKFNCTCFCTPVKNANRLSNAAATYAPILNEVFLFSYCRLKFVKHMIYRRFLISLTRQIYPSSSVRCR